MTATPAGALPPGCCLRRAIARDRWTIRKLVFSEKLDPTQLRWQNFWVIEFEHQIIACGQLRTLDEGQELGSLVVLPNWRKQGLGTYLTRHLSGIATQPLYLECLGQRLAEFYRRLGFVEADWDEMPRSLKRKFGLTRFVSRVFSLPLHILHYQSPSTTSRET